MKEQLLECMEKLKGKNPCVWLDMNKNEKYQENASDMQNLALLSLVLPKRDPPSLSFNTEGLLLLFFT